MKNFNLASTLLGAVIGALISFFGYNATIQKKLNDYDTYLEAENKLIAEQKQTTTARDEFAMALTGDQDLKPNRGKRLKKKDVDDLTEFYDFLAKKLKKDNSSLGIHIGAGFSYGFDKVEQLLEDIRNENMQDKDSTNYITGIRVHMGVKESIINGKEGYHLDGIISPVRLDGTTVIAWTYGKDLKNRGFEPPYLDDSNPCPDACP